MIGIIGAGSFGTALGAVLANNTKDPVYIYGENTEQLKEINENNTNSHYLPGIKLPSNLAVKFDCEELITTVNDLLIVIPSSGFAGLLTKLKPILKTSQRIAWATKGLESSTGRFLHQVIEDTLGAKQQYAVISGPSFAKEVANGMPTAVAIAANTQEFAKDLAEQFLCDNFRVYNNNDIIGVQLGGIIKNIFAVACGICDGLGLGANARAAIITRGMAEMLKLGIVLGAKQSTMMGLAGLGDLILTCTDDKSRNRRLGLALGKGSNLTTALKEIGQAVEGLDNCSAICRLAEKYNIELPIASTVESILIGKITPEEAVTELISRKPTTEFN